MFPERIKKIPCVAHRLNLCVTDLFSEKTIIEKNQHFYIFAYNDEGLLRKKEITEEEKNEIESLNEVKSKISKLIKKCRHLVGSFKHSDNLNRRLKEKQNEYKLDKKKQTRSRYKNEME